MCPAAIGIDHGGRRPPRGIRLFPVVKSRETLDFH